jgi:hypothetical protein
VFRTPGREHLPEQSRENGTDEQRPVLVNTAKLTTELSIDCRAFANCDEIEVDKAPAAKKKVRKK